MSEYEINAALNTRIGPSPGGRKLMAYMMGWKRGASASATTDLQMLQKDFKSGWDDGRKAVVDAYEKATVKYQSALSPLR